MINGQFDLNLVVIGKSGAGKSSFCNYLFNKPNHFTTGKGKPVTGWKDNFSNHNFKEGNFSFNVFDSVGLEADNLSEWNERFKSFLNERRITKRMGFCNFMSGVEPGQWIHGFFYVLNANSGRIEPAEIELINQAAKYGSPIMLVLTNCDVAGPKVGALREAVKKVLPNLSVHEVCSVAVRKRSGESTSYGREEVLRDYTDQCQTTLQLNLARFACSTVIQALRKMKQLTVSKIEFSNISVFNISDFNMDEIMDTSGFEKHFESIDFFRDYLNDFGFFNGNLHDFHSEIQQKLEDSFNEATSIMERRLNTVSNNLENGGLSDRISAVFKIAKTAITLRSSMSTMLSEVFDHTISAMYSLDTSFEEQLRIKRT